jgi:hypothetical protein
VFFLICIVLPSYLKSLKLYAYAVGSFVLSVMFVTRGGDVYQFQAVYEFKNDNIIVNVRHA